MKGFFIMMFTMWGVGQCCPYSAVNMVSSLFGWVQQLNIDWEIHQQRASNDKVVELWTCHSYYTARESKEFIIIALHELTWLLPSVSEHKVEQETDNTEDYPHCCQKVEDYYKPKSKRVNDLLWSAIWWYPICSSTNASFLLLFSYCSKQIHSIPSL